MTDNTKFGVALGGGAILGAAHVGVLRALDESVIDTHCVSGTSIGAYIAGLYAFDVPLSKIEESIDDLHWLDVSGFSLSQLKLGILSNDKLGDSINEILGEVRIEDAERGLAILATDISSGDKVALKEGPLSEAVMASTCVPGIYSPVTVGDQLLVDGGLVENVPLSPLAEMGAEATIAVDLSAHRSLAKPDNIIDVLLNSIDIAIDNSTKLQTSEADIVIAPKLQDYSRTDTRQVQAIIEEGYTACRQALAASDVYPR